MVPIAQHGEGQVDDGFECDEQAAPVAGFASDRAADRFVWIVAAEQHVPELIQGDEDALHGQPASTLILASAATSVAASIAALSVRA